MFCEMRAPRAPQRILKEGEELIIRLRERRKNLGLSRRALSLRLGYSGETIRHWESGQNNPSFPSLLAWAQCLGMKLRLDEEEDD